AELECRHSRDVGRERQYLQIEHQLDVLLPGVRHTDWSRRQFPMNTAGVVLFNLLDAAFDLSHAIQICAEPAAILRTQFGLEPRYFARDSIQNAAIGFLPRRAIRF